MITEVYKINDTTTHVIFDNTTTELNQKEVAHSIIWEQDAMYIDNVVLRLTQHKTNEVSEFYNVGGIFQTPADIYYSKIELVGRGTQEGTIKDDGNPPVCHGQISYNSINVSSIEIIEDYDWSYFLENTQLQLFTIPAGVSFEEMVDKNKIYEYVELFYTLDSPVSVQGAEEQETDKNKLFINGIPYTATKDWNAVIPGKAIPYNALITKEDNVRVDIYARVWTGEPGVRV